MTMASRDCSSVQDHGLGNLGWSQLRAVCFHFVCILKVTVTSGNVTNKTSRACQCWQKCQFLHVRVLHVGFSWCITAHSQCCAVRPLCNVHILLLIVSGRHLAMYHCCCHQWGLHLFNSFVALPSGDCWAATKSSTCCLCHHRSEDTCSTTASQSAPAAECIDSLHCYVGPVS